MSLPNLLFVTPAMPSPLGTGSMLRAAMTLEALSRRFRVHVLNLNVWSWGAGQPAFVAQHAESYVELPPHSGDVDTASLLTTHFAGIDFVAIHTFKLVVAWVTMGMVASLKPRRPYLVLDLDDDECARSASMMRLLEQAGDLAAIRQGKADEMQLRMMERMMVPRFDAITLAGIDDCPVLAKRYPNRAVHHLPNAIDLAGRGHTQPPPLPFGVAGRLLFVGALYYAPNADGLCFFVEHVLPLVEQGLGGPVSLRIVGAEPLGRVSQLSRHKGVTVYPNVPSVTPFYEEADVCIVPLRAGSGTRIKILEAFSHRRAVISTRLGAEGLDLKSGQELLIANEPEAFARACVQLLQDRLLRERMAASGNAWVAAHHSVDNVALALEAVYQPVLAP
jgi:glycosyltransferase involved in cell wall biosynthesis